MSAAGVGSSLNLRGLGPGGILLSRVNYRGFIWHKRENASESNLQQYFESVVLGGSLRQLLFLGGVGEVIVNLVSFASAHIEVGDT